MHDSVPLKTATMSLIGAVSITGWVTGMTVDSAVDGDIFLNFLDEFLCPKLEPGHIVVMDNLRVHKVDGVEERIAARQAKLVYLPPYSPDFNPIELCWAQLKKYLRAAKARTVSALHEALKAAWPHLTPTQAAEYYRHCGYQI